MISWGRVPALRMVVPYILGLIVPDYSFTGNFLFIVFVFFLISLSWRATFPLIKGMFTFLFVFFLGMFTASIHAPGADPTHIIKDLPGDPAAWIGEVRSSRYSGKGKHNLLVEVHGMKQEQWVQRSGKCQLTVNDTGVLPLPGSLIIFYARLKHIPDSGSYALHLIHHGVYCRGYAEKGNVLLLDPDFSLRWYSARLRSFFIEKMKEKGVAGNSLAVAKALILGSDEDIPEDVRAHYSNTGAVHILSVSGLHVGLVFLLLNKIFGKIFRQRKWIIIRTGCVIAGLLFYALLTGLSPSVLRSAAMFVLFALADSWKKRVEPVNTLAFSCLALLMWDPLLVYDIGFQLSYSAVFGILLFYPSLRELVESRFRLLQWSWEMTAVSIASQLTTFPLILFYFGKFPVLFLFVNLLVIPLSTALLYTGLFLVLFWWIPWVGDLAGTLLHHGMQLMNNILEFFSDISFAVLENIGIGLITVLGIYILLWTVSAWLYRQDRRYLMGSLFILLALQSYSFLSH